MHISVCSNGGENMRRHHTGRHSPTTIPTELPQSCMEIMVFKKSNQTTLNNELHVPTTFPPVLIRHELKVEQKTDLNVEEETRPCPWQHSYHFWSDTGTAQILSLAAFLPLLIRYRHSPDLVPGSILTTSEPIQAEPWSRPWRHSYHFWADTGRALITSLAAFLPLLSRYRQSPDHVPGGILTTSEPIQAEPRPCPWWHSYHFWADTGRAQTLSLAAFLPLLSRYRQNPYPITGGILTTCEQIQAQPRSCPWRHSYHFWADIGTAQILSLAIFVPVLSWYRQRPSDLHTAWWYIIVLQLNAMRSPDTTRCTSDRGHTNQSANRTHASLSSWQSYRWWKLNMGKTDIYWDQVTLVINLFTLWMQYIITC